jgi:hypothetical protein
MYLNLDRLPLCCQRCMIVAACFPFRLPFPYSMNKELTESSLLILSMVSASRLATLN